MTIELPEWYSIGNGLIELAFQRGLKFDKCNNTEAVAEIIQSYGIDCGAALGIGVHKIIKEEIGNSLGETERVAMLLRQREEFWGFTLWYYGEKTNFDDEGIFNYVYYKVKPKPHEGLVRAALSTYEVAVRVCPQELRAIILEKSGIGFGNGRVFEKIFYKWRKKKIVSWSEKDGEDISREKIEKGISRLLLG